MLRDPPTQVEKVELVAFVDESGSSNYPGTLDDQQDFCWTAIITDQSSVESIQRIDEAMRGAVGKSDYKYRHIVRSDEARRALIKEVRSSHIRVMSRFSCGPGLFLYRRRQMRGANRREGALDSQDTVRGNLDLSIEMFGHELASMAMFEPANLEVSFDRRSDSDHLLEVCDEAIQRSLRWSGLNLLDSQVSLAQASSPLQKAGARVAGIFAGDCRKFFGERGGLVWRSLELPIHTASAESENTRKVASHRAKLSGGHGADSKNTAMLRCYWKHLYRRRVRFLSPTGSRGWIEIRHGADWSVYQGSDRPSPPGTRDLPPSWPQ